MTSTEPDAEGTRRIAAMDGAEGAQTQFELLQQRSLELIDQRFDLFRIHPAQGVCVKGGEGPFLETRD